jgi:hypothetical protein
MNCLVLLIIKGVIYEADIVKLSHTRKFTW